MEELCPYIFLNITPFTPGRPGLGDLVDSGMEPQFSFMQGTTANSVSTGLTATQGPQNYGPRVWDALQESWVSRQSLPRLGQPEDVADVVGLLCSREARWITGSKVSANGGSVKIL